MLLKLRIYRFFVIFREYEKLQNIFKSYRMKINNRHNDPMIHNLV